MNEKLEDWFYRAYPSPSTPPDTVLVEIYGIISGKPIKAEVINYQNDIVTTGNSNNFVLGTPLESSELDFMSSNNIVNFAISVKENIKVQEFMKKMIERKLWHKEEYFY